MFCECISNWYEVYWILNWNKAQEQQNSHKQNSVTYPADCLPNRSHVYLFDFLVLKLGPGNRITYCNEYVFTAVVTTAYSDNDVLYFSVISCEIWLLRNYVGQIGREITWEIVNGHLAVLLRIEAASTSCSHRSSNLLRLCFSSEQQLLPHIRLLSKNLSRVTRNNIVTNSNGAVLTVNISRPQYSTVKLDGLSHPQKSSKSSSILLCQKSGHFLAIFKGKHILFPLKTIQCIIGSNSFSCYTRSACICIT